MYALHLYLLTRFSNEKSGNVIGVKALHLYLLTRFSNRRSVESDSAELYTFIYLQGSQTLEYPTIIQDWLYTFIYLQGSQTDDED